MNTDDIAVLVLKAVKKNRLYVFPQLSSKLFWLNKRLMPSVFHGLLAYLYKRGLFGPVMMSLARRGML
jgi:hypothetical protein